MEENKNNTFKGIINFTKSGHANIEIGNEKLFIHKTNVKNALHLDEVEVIISLGYYGEEVEVKKILKRFRTKFSGVVHKNKKATFVKPDNPRINEDFYIRGGLIAKNNQKVVVELTKYEEGKSPQAKIIKILGNTGDNDAEMNSIMVEYGLPVDFPQEVLNEAELIPEVITDKEISKRRDMRNITTITIDPLTAKDLDDALSISFHDNYVEVGVHIADISHYVKPGTEIDKEAYERSTSVYLVDRCISMLPEKLSNGICSLVPNEDRLAFSVVFKIDNSGKIIDKWFGKTIIHSDRRFTYEEAQEIIDNGAGECSKEILKLNSIAKLFRKERMKHSLEMNNVEVGFKLGSDNKKPIGIYKKYQKDANKLIEEFMLLANKSVSKKLKTSGLSINRVHEEPDNVKLEQLESIASSLGFNFKLKSDTNELRKEINNLVKSAKGTNYENIITTLVVRSQMKAYYSIEDIGHYGLGFKDYTHFTSGIRRYPDIMAHRILENIINTGNHKMNPNEMSEKTKWCSKRELVASKAERDSIKYKQVEYLQDKIGSVFDAVISSVTDFGLFVELVESKCNGLILYNDLDDYWQLDLNNHKIENGVQVMRLGDEVKVTLKSVNLEKREINFKLF